MGEPTAKVVLGVAYIAIALVDLVVGMVLIGDHPATAVVSFVGVLAAVSVLGGARLRRAFGNVHTLPRRVGSLLARVVLLALPVGVGGAALLTWMFHRVSTSAGTGLDLGLVVLGAMSGFLAAFGLAWILAARTGDA